MGGRRPRLGLRHVPRSDLGPRRPTGHPAQAHRRAGRLPALDLCQSALGREPVGPTERVAGGRNPPPEKPPPPPPRPLPFPPPPFAQGLTGLSRRCDAAWQPVLELFIALVLIGLNGLFALSELAVVSSRKSRLKVMADAGRQGATAALVLAEDPGRFLSTVQIGITLVSILAGAFSGAALGAALTEALTGWGVARGFADPLGYGAVIATITYLSVVIGELVPKHLALKNAEGIACIVAPPMAFVSRLGAPVVWLLDASTKLVFRLFGERSEPAS